MGTSDVITGQNSNEMFDELYVELRALAGSVLAGQAQVTLQPTMLVHEVFLKLAKGASGGQFTREHFMALAARAMRQVAVDYARKRAAAANAARGALQMQASDEPTLGAADVLVIDEALTRLRDVDKRACQLAEFRVFGGLTLEDAANVMGLARSTAAEDWRFARAWLISALG